MKKCMCYVIIVLFVIGVFFVPKIAEATGSGTLRIGSSPAGADVFIDGVFKKKVTACEITVPAGRHKIELKIEGYVPYVNENVSIISGKTTSLQGIIQLPYMKDVDQDHVITVNTLEDKVRWSNVSEMDAFSISMLKSQTGTPVSLREAITAVKNEPLESGHYRIEFDRSLSGGTIHLFDQSVFHVPEGIMQDLYIEKRGNLTINGDIDRNGTPDITLDPSQNGISGTMRSYVMHAYASNVYLEGIIFHGSDTPYAEEDAPGSFSTLTMRVPDDNILKYDVENVYVLGCRFINSGVVGLGTCGKPGNAGTSYGGDRTANFKNIVFSGNTFDNTGICDYAGAGDEDYNVIDGCIIAANKFTGKGIGLSAADAHSYYVFGKDSGPFEYCSHNQLKNARISGNNIIVTATYRYFPAIAVQTSNLGNSDNLVENVTIRNNYARAIPSSPDPGPPQNVSYSNIQIINVCAGADERYTYYTIPGFRHNTANNTMRNIKVQDNYLEGGNGRYFTVCNVHLGNTEKSGMDSTGNLMEHIIIDGNTIVSTNGMRIFGVGGDMTLENNDVSRNTMRDIHFDNNTLKRNDNGLYEHRGLIIANFCDQMSTYSPSFHDNTFSDISVKNNKISNYRTGIIVTGSTGNGANGHSLEDVTISGNEVVCQPDGDFGIIAAGAAFSSYGTYAFNGSADCTVKKIAISNNTITAPGGILLAGSYIDSGVKKSIKGNALIDATVTDNNLNAAKKANMRLPGMIVADIAEHEKGFIKSGTNKTDNSAGKPSVSGNIYNGFDGNEVNLSKVASNYPLKSTKTAAQILSDLTSFTNSQWGIDYKWKWDGPAFTSASPGNSIAVGTSDAGNGIYRFYKYIHTLNVAEYTISAAAQNKSYGTVKGGGNYYTGSTAMLTAKPKSGYRFVRWLEGTKKVSSNYQYSFTVTKSRTFKAEFATIGKPSLNYAAAAGKGKIKIKWESISFAKGYYIYRSTKSNSDFNKVGESTTTSFTDSGLIKGKKYYYKIIAYCTAGPVITTGKYSNIKSAKPGA